MREIVADLRSFAFEKHRRLFARPKRAAGRHPVLHTPGDIVPDGIGAARCMAIEVLDVEGEKVLPGGARTQDFLLVNYLLRRRAHLPP